MKTTITFLTATLALLMASGASAQTDVYETRDAEGNASFSDESSPGSEKIEIQPTMVVDAPNPAPAEPSRETQASGGEPMQQSEGDEVENVYNNGGDYIGDDPRVLEDGDYYRRNELTPGVEPVEREDRRVMQETPGGYDEDAVGRADKAAERSDISGPNAEYRNHEREGERR